jgi:predicted transglutaminase-like cysteine proteinase
MRLLKRAAFAVVFSVLSSGAALAGGPFEREYGTTLPPYGYVDYCAKNRMSCVTSAPPATIASSPVLLGLISQINGYINDTVTATTDQDLYGVVENWTLPGDRGDCEDYVLLKKQALENLGLPRGAFLITVVLDELLAGHAVLTVRTTDGDIILDNRRNEVLPWHRTGYTFLKRQSSENPSEWASLMQAVDLSKKQISASK